MRYFSTRKFLRNSLHKKNVGLWFNVTSNLKLECLFCQRIHIENFNELSKKSRKTFFPSNIVNEY